MSKRHGRKYYNRKGPNPLGLLILLVFGLVYQHWKIILPVVALAGAGFLLWHFTRNKKRGIVDQQEVSPIHTDISYENSQRTYSAKESIMTECEKAFFDVFKEIVEPNYTVQPQVNLASVVDKDPYDRYRNELFRNIDFGVFDDKYALLLLIEINDQSHMQKNRSERDSKVRSICEEAGIPIIAFWTKYGINKQYIHKRLSEYLPLIADEKQKEISN